MIETMLKALDVRDRWIFDELDRMDPKSMLGVKGVKRMRAVKIKGRKLAVFLRCAMCSRKGTKASLEKVGERYSGWLPGNMRYKVFACRKKCSEEYKAAREVVVRLTGRDTFRGQYGYDIDSGGREWMSLMNDEMEKKEVTPWP